jgi:hypothetical protein
MTSSPITDETLDRAWKAAVAVMEPVNADGGVAFFDVKLGIKAALQAARSSAPPVIGMEEMVERVVQQHISVEKKVAAAHEKVSHPQAVAAMHRIDAIERLWRDISQALSTPLVTGRDEKGVSNNG